MDIEKKKKEFFNLSIHKVRIYLDEIPYNLRNKTLQTTIHSTDLEEQWKWIEALIEEVSKECLGKPASQSFSYLNKSEIKEIKEMVIKGYSYGQIGKKLGRHRQTIFDYVKRNRLKAK